MELSNDNNFYYEQSIQIRKEIRELDMTIYTKNQQKTSDVQSMLETNIVVIGPKQSGKTSLLKTMHFSLNGSWENCEEIINVSISSFIIRKIQIKKGKKHTVQGLSKMKETDQKKTVVGFQIESEGQSKSSKYSKAIQLINNKVLTCIKQNPIFNPFDSYKAVPNIKVCLICLHISKSVDKQQLEWIRFFLADLKEKNLKALIVLTQIDSVQNFLEKQKLEFLDHRISYFMKELSLNDRSDVVCMQSYHNWKQNGAQANKVQIKNCEKINFYALKLLQRCIKQGDIYCKYNAKGKKSLKGFLCG